MTTAFITHPCSIVHKIAAIHPESPERINKILDLFKQRDLLSKLKCIQARVAEVSDLKRVHESDYVQWIIENAPTQFGQVLQIDADTAMNEHSLEASLTAVGAVLDAVDLVMGASVKNAFCCVRPPGHHAEHDRAMGFCFFNNIAVGAQYALDHYGLSRVGIVDFDVHHGNGTEDIFRDEARVLFCSSFQEDIFPGKALPSQSGHIINLPLAAQTDGALFRRKFEQTILPELEAFKPQLVFISAGFDAHKNDPLANLNLVAEDFAWITEKIMQIAQKHAQSRLVSSLEGGYDLDGLAQSAAAHVSVLLGQNSIIR